MRARASTKPTSRPAAPPAKPAIALASSDRQRHEQQHRGEDRRAEQVAVVFVAAAARHEVGDGPRAQQAERRAVAADGQRRRIDGDRQRDAAHPAQHEEADDHERPVAALQQPPEDRDGGDRGQLVPDARVQEGRRRHPPPLAVDRPRDADVGQRNREEQQVAEEREDDERQRRVRARRELAADAGDLAGAKARQPRCSRLARLARLARLGDRAVALDLRRALAQPVAAVRTLGDVGTDLVAAVLADDVEIGHLCHCCPDSRPARTYALNRRCPRPMNECGGTPSRRLPIREPSRAQRAILRASCARARDRDHPRRAPRGPRGRPPAARRGRDELRARPPDRDALGHAAGRRRRQRALSHRRRRGAARAAPLRAPELHAADPRHAADRGRRPRPARRRPCRPSTSAPAACCWTARTCRAPSASSSTCPAATAR